MSYEHIITVEPDHRSAKPCIRGLRIPFHIELESPAKGMNEDEVPADSSGLIREDITTCPSFAANRERKLFTATA